jgi:hypothetical protein
MVERISFTLQFMFNDKDQAKALKLHRLLKSYGVVGNIVRSNKVEGINKSQRLERILQCMIPGRVYTTGQLWNAYPSSTGMKTFQRDLNTLVIEGRINGFHTRKKGNTILWSIGGKQDDTFSDNSISA